MKMQKATSGEVALNVKLSATSSYFHMNQQQQRHGKKKKRKEKTAGKNSMLRGSF